MISAVPDDPIVFDDVSMSYETPPVYVVRDFSLAVHRGEFFCLVGQSGCGKSTVLKMIARIEAPSMGSLKRPERIGMVFQSFALLPWLTVEGNIAFAAKMRGFDKEKVAEQTERYLRIVHLERFAGKFPRALSGGERQRVGIARALAIEPDVLVLDEPFSALDPVITDELHEDLLSIWQATKKTIVMVSHRFEEAVILADRVGIMRNGRLEEILTIDLARPRREEDTAFMQEVTRIRQCLRDG